MHYDALTCSDKSLASDTRIQPLGEVKGRVVHPPHLSVPQILEGSAFTTSQTLEVLRKVPEDACQLNFCGSARMTGISLLSQGLDERPSPQCVHPK